MAHQHGGNFILRSRGRVLAARSLEELARFLVTERLAGAEKAEGLAALEKNAGYRPLTAGEQERVVVFAAARLA